MEVGLHEAGHDPEPREIESLEALLRPVERRVVTRVGRDSSAFQEEVTGRERPFARGEQEPAREQDALGFSS